MSVWLVRAGRHGEHEARFLNEGRVYLTRRDFKQDLSKFKTVEAMLAFQRERTPEREGRANQVYGHQVWRFTRQIEKGDWVVTPSKFKPAIHIGEVTSDYRFDPNGEDPYLHYREVRWFAPDIPRSNFDQDLLYSFGAFITVCKIERNDAEVRLKAMAQRGWKPSPRASAPVTVDVEPDAEEAVLRDLEEEGRDQIASLITRRLKGHGLERLVQAVLEAQGYTVYRSPEGADRGVDLLAAPGPLGFGRPRICVQVKSGDAPVDTPTLHQLIGSMQNVGADQGLLVSWGGFKASVDREVPQQFFRVRLWDRDQLISELLQHYGHLAAEIRAELPLKQFWTVAQAEEESE